MTAPISGVSGITGMVASPFGIAGVGASTGITGTTSIGATGTVSSTGSAGGSDFASMLASSLDNLQATQSHADQLATQAATGNLQDVHDYMIASNEASLATQMAVTIKNQAVSAFNEIMRMPV
jgi:flagellar hook-basal body complex protein FliE